MYAISRTLICFSRKHILCGLVVKMFIQRIIFILLPQSKIQHFLDMPLMDFIQKKTCFFITYITYACMYFDFFSLQ